MARSDTVAIVLHGTRPVLMPAAGRWGTWTMRPGVARLGVDHWEAMSGSLAREAEELHAAVASGLLGPVETTPKPAPRKPPEPAPEPLGEPSPKTLKDQSRVEPPEEVSVSFDIPDDWDEEEDEAPTLEETPKKAAPKKKAAKAKKAKGS